MGELYFRLGLIVAGLSLCLLLVQIIACKAVFREQINQKSDDAKYLKEARKLFDEYISRACSWDEVAMRIMVLDYKFAEKMFFPIVFKYVRENVSNHQAFLKKLRNFQAIEEACIYSPSEIVKIKNNMFSPEELKHFGVVYRACPRSVRDEILKGGI